MKSKNFLTKLLFIAAGILALAWSLVVPIFEFPDEQAHFAMVQFLAEKGRVPEGKEHDLSAEVKGAEDLLGTFRDRLGNNRYTYHPDYHPEYTDTVIGKYEREIQGLNTLASRTTMIWTEAARYPALYYAYSALWYRLAYTGDLLTRLFVVRLGSVLLSSLTVFVAYLLGREIFAKESYARTLAAMVLLHPMLSFVGAGVNSDNLHNLLFAGFFLFLIRYLKRDLGFGEWLGLIAAMVADVYTKPQAYIMAPIVGLAILMRLVRTGWEGIGWRKWFAAGLSVAALAAPQEASKVFGYTSFPDSVPTHLSFVEFVRFSLNKFISQNIVWYWGVYKWLGVVLPKVWWWTANRLVALSAVGVAIGLYRRPHKQAGISSGSVIVFLALSVAIYISAIFGYDWIFATAHGYSFGVQARYYFPVIVPSLALVLYGFTALGWNEMVRELLRRLLVLFFVGLQLGGLWRLITSYYSVSSLPQLINQISQYKPFFAKGDWWYLWGGVYVAALTIILIVTLGYRADKDTHKI